MSEINPFLSLSRVIGEQYKRGARGMRDAQTAHTIQTTLAMHAAQHEAVTRQNEQQAKITERSEKGKSKRATEFTHTVHGMAEPGTAVKISHGNISASFTKANAPKPPASPKPGRVPVKKIRGGKRPR